MRSHPPVAVAPLLALLACLGCGETSDGNGQALFTTFDPSQRSVEQRSLGSPVSGEPNRFLHGWRPWSLNGRESYRSSGAESTFRLVKLDEGARSLVLDVLQAPPSGDAWTVTLSHAEAGEVLRFEISDLSRIDLPAGIPAGVLTVALAPPPGTEPVVVAQAAVRPVDADLGEATIEDDILVQTGDSSVSVPFHTSSEVRIAGRFCPPTSSGESREASVELIDPSGAVLDDWRWEPGVFDRFLGCREVELSSDRAGVVAARFTVRGEGAPVTWPAWRWMPAAGSTWPSASAGDPRVETVSREMTPPALVLVYVMDALRADTVGHLGGRPGVSPTYDRLAAEGFTFRAHRSVAPNTLPSTRALFTGRTYVSETDWRRHGRLQPMLAEIFSDAGYRTGAFSGNVYVSPAYGTVRGFEYFAEEAQLDASWAERSPYNDSAELVHRAALDWLETIPAEDPAFLYLHTIHPHNPYAPPADLERRFTGGIDSSIRGSTKTLLQLQKGELVPSPADEQRIEALYAASLAYNDRELARFLARVEELRGEREVLLVLTSDHGEELFEHGSALHGETLYEEQLRIPLVVWSPGRVERGETSETTDTLDLHATLIELAAIAGERRTGHRPADSEGRSLLTLLATGESDLPRKLFFASAPSLPGRVAAVFDGRHKRIEARRGEESWGMGEGPGRSWNAEYLFDLANDPEERVNRGGQGGIADAWLKVRLGDWLASRWTGDEDGIGDAPGPDEAIDEKTQERLRALGYLD